MSNAKQDNVALQSDKGNDVLPPSDKPIPGSSSSDSDNDKTMVEKRGDIEVDSVAELRMEIRALKASLEILMKSVKPSPSIEVVQSAVSTDTKAYTSLQSATLPPTSSPLPNGNMPASNLPMQQRLSTYPYSFNMNSPSPYLSVHMPQPSVHANHRLMPPYVPNTTHISPSMQLATTYMPSWSQQSTTQLPQSPSNNAYSPPSPLHAINDNINTSSQTRTYLPPYATQPLTSTSGIFAENAATMQVPMAHQVNENRPIRKLCDLPEFNGQPEQWPMFSVSYRETTLSYNYTKLENLSRLQKALKGDAKAKVEAYLVHPDSVDQVMSTLEFHYGRPQILIRSQITKVRAFPTINSRRIFEIINFSTMVVNLTAFLENAGAAPHLCNPTLLDELVNKLPLAKREEWIRYSMHNLGQYPNVKQFSVWLQDIATYISLATETDPDRCEPPANKNGRVKQSFTITTEEHRQLSCALCRENHYLYQCSKFKNTTIAERWKLAKDKRLCFSCLRADHNSSACSYRRQCGLSGCTKSHNRLLHEGLKNINNAKTEKGKQTISAVTDGTLPITNVNENDSKSVTTIVGDYLDKRTLFKYLPVQLKGPNGSVNIIAFVDEGSKISLLEENVAKEIGIQGPRSNLSLGWIGGKRSNESSMKINLEICNLTEGKRSFQMKNVRTTAHLKLPRQSLQFEKFKENFEVLKDIFVNEYLDATPKLLIGLPHVRLVRPHNVINLDDNFSVHQTALGNILFGSNEENAEATVCVIDVYDLNDIRKQVAEYFTLEGFGMRPVNPVISDSDKRAEEILQRTTVKTGLQYETGLLWKVDAFEFKDSYSVALKRLQAVEAKMRKDKNLADWYKAKIEEYVSKGYARRLSQEEAAMEDSHTWYLPHFGIMNANKNNKRRLVFDAAATVDGVSFNSRLMKGPEKYQPKPLLSILFKFRQRQIGICGDIREMFHRVKIREPDQTAQRFLWRGGISTMPPDVYVMQAMIFGSASSPCSAQYVKNINAKQFEKTDPRAYEAIVECHYVDDYVDCFDTIGEATAVTQRVISIHQQAGFQLRGFVSNSSELCCCIENTDNSNLKSLCSSETATEKVLGMFWSPNDDTFRFILQFTRVPREVLNGSRIPTKSEVLSLTMSIFDPFGFLANIVIRSKIMLQELWRYEIDWNMPIPLQIYKRWYEWYTELQNVQYVKIARCYSPMFTDPSTNVELHIFVDASEMAFAAVAYWKVVWEGHNDIKFVAGKSKCAPIKPLSIPRLELQAAVLGVRLKEAIVSSHIIQPRRITFWSDSKTVVKWIQSDCRIYKQFVSHRIAEVLDLSTAEQWRWVPGSKNPADDATRPQYFSGKTSESRWLNGPQFLKSDEEHWPKLAEDSDKIECEAEIRSKFLMTITEVRSIIPYNEKSKYIKLLRITCWITRAIKIFKCYAFKQNISDLNFSSYLTVKELNAAAVYWCKIAQQDEFAKEYNTLKNGNPVSKRSPIYNLNPCIGEDGLIRMSGRIKNAVCVSQHTKNPIIMPKNHTITKLIVKQHHDDYRHQNQESICAAIRTKFWIPCLRQMVRSAKSNCQECKNRNAAPKIPLMGQLPEDRITPFVRPFTYTGVDYLGPYTVSIGRRCEKRWVALFTCLTSRAIHLELAKDLSTDAVILCIRNFVNRRGVPVRIRSDRGTNFIGASKEQFAADEAKLADEFTRRGIEWVFNTPANPSAGGAWERMVRAVKNILSYTLKEKSPQAETLNSLLIEAENLVNSRPLTHLPIESVDCDPLTPNHFLLGCPNIVQTPAVDEKVCLRKQWRILQQLKQIFWKRWVLEYLPDLTRRTKWHQPVKPLAVGDVVIICDETETRGEWKRGVVLEVFTAADGQVRSALVKTSVGKLRRPASKLAVLDVGGESP